MKLNITIEVYDNQEAQRLVDFIDEHAHVHDWSILTDTSVMYKEDSFYRGLAKVQKKSKQVLNDYINENNSKYK